MKSAVYDYSLYTPDYYAKGFLAGSVCCSVALVQDEVANRIYRGMDAKPAETSKARSSASASRRARLRV